ncbi:alcohol oxidase [Blastomyces gilchristii SLH14081]|uniref:Alcohol oxidase n=1 Tax=Blastomyces gilchristii (strain SLH14081) TaxID=559298 RepID=A0A179URP2_BLAGS|nr:alcohol oxidase [Blastomyces gilchristii SLH14081]OAT10443.1 alcohol oxidase [Blastomyces gilchristii SLH14081]
MAESDVDIIVVGGGTTGLITAGRLAQAKPDLSILVIEAGINSRNNPMVVNPAIYLSNIAPDSTTAKFYKSKASDYLGGREAIVPIGNILGGGSSINFMVYTRAQEIDYDDWNTEGWTGKDMIPFIKKIERFQDTDPEIDKSIHGYNGELSVSAGGTYVQASFQKDFFKACEDIGIKKVPDVQDFKTANAVGRWNMWIDEKTGLRQDVPHNFLFPILDAGNTKLKVLTDSTVVRVLFDESNRANGVEYVPTGADPSTAPIIAHAKQLVLVAANALGTPQVLQRSGIGNKSKLEALGIPVVSDLNGVGSNYQDHHGVFYSYSSKATAEETLDGLLTGRLPLEQALLLKASNPTRHLLGWNGLDCFGKLRPSETEVNEFGTALQEAWDKDFRHRETRPLMLMCAIAANLARKGPPVEGQYFSMVSYTAYPYSRGSIHITGKSVTDTPEFDAGFLNHPADIMKLVWGYKKQREIARRLPYYNGPHHVGHPAFPPRSKADPEVVDAASKAKGYPVPIEYSEADNKAIEECIRENLTTTWHSMSTCAMKPREDGGVVDKDLNVYGVKNLKVVDLSICPSNVAANTYSTALAIGEKAASIIARELGIPYTV